MAGAFEAGVKALARRELSRAEVEERLSRSGFACDEIEPAIDRLVEAGYQSDERAAIERARAMASRRYGDIAIRADLRRRGIADEETEQALTSIPSEAERARLLAHRTPDASRLAQALYRKGYTESTIERVAELGATGVG